MNTNVKSASRGTRHREEGGRDAQTTAFQIAGKLSTSVFGIFNNTPFATG